jgi:integrase/recombinase XerD
MALTIYRRHSIDCEVHTLKLSERAKRFYKDCECKIWITGTTDTERFPRQAIGLTDWKAAEAHLASLVSGAKDTAIHGPTLSDCIQRHLDAHATNIGERAFDYHRLTLARLLEFAKSRNKVFIRELNVDLLEDFKTYTFAEFKSTSKRTAEAKLKFFLREAYRRSWTTEALAEKVKSTKAVYEQKQPYTDKEVKVILAQAEKLKDGGKNGFASNGKTFRLLLELMLETGLRVSDAIRYDPKRCVKSKHLWRYSFEQKKQKRNEQPKQAEVFLASRLKKAIDQCGWFSENLPFAYRELNKSTTVMEYAVYERMKAIGKRCGIDDCRPHRLRDTFAVRMLMKGVALEDVSKLLCHSSIAVTEKYYAAWIPSRKLRLEGVLAKALVD